MVCASVIVKRVNIQNACSILTEASYYHAAPLVRSIQEYITINLETFLESHLLDDLPIDIVRQLSAFIRDQQAVKSPVSRSGILTTRAMGKYKEWVASEDFPQPVTKSSVHPSRITSSAKHSPPGSLKKLKNIRLSMSPSTSPVLRPQIISLVPQPPNPGVHEDEVFLMDENVPSLALNQSTPMSSKLDLAEDTSNRPTVSWKVSTVPKLVFVPRVYLELYLTIIVYRMDMKSIMAEAATSRLETSRHPFSSNSHQSATPGPADAQNWRTPQRITRQLPDTTPERPSAGRNISGSPWRMPSAGNLRVSPVNTPPTSSHIQPPRPANEVSSLSPSKPATPSKPSGLPRESPPPPRVPGLGPVFSPSKQSPSKSGSLSGTRRVA